MCFANKEATWQALLASLHCLNAQLSYDIANTLRVIVNGTLELCILKFLILEIVILASESTII